MVGSAGTCQHAAAARHSQARRRARPAYDAGVHLRPRLGPANSLVSDWGVERTTGRTRKFNFTMGIPWFLRTCTRGLFEGDPRTLGIKGGITTLCVWSMRSLLDVSGD